MNVDCSSGSGSDASIDEATTFGKGSGCCQYRDATSVIDAPEGGNYSKC